jgi:hypothetical protein
LVSQTTGICPSCGCGGCKWRSLAVEESEAVTYSDHLRSIGFLNPPLFLHFCM